MSGISTTSSLTAAPFLYPKISILPVRIIIIVTFTIAMTAVLSRFVALVTQRRNGTQRKQKWIQMDDIFLLFATIFLIAATTLLLCFLDTIYFVENLSLNGAVALIGSPDAANWIQKISYYLQMNWGYVSLSWACIFFVKFSFLSFFSGLCDRLPKVELYRKCVYGFCIIVGMVEIISSFATCAHLGLDAVQCSTPDSLKKSIAMGIATTTLDMATDIAILMIPITLLWKVRLRAYQKMIIGIFLLGSIVMLVLAIVRIAGMNYYGTIDYSWTCLWYHSEACAAVTMISLTAFRSAFLPNANANSKYRPWEASIPRFIKKWQKSSSTDSTELDLDDVLIPSATMTGMRTFIGRGDDEESATPPVAPNAIGVEKSFYQTVNQDYHIPKVYYSEKGGAMI